MGDQLNEKMKNRNSQKNNWDKAQIFGTLLIPVVIAISGYFINNTIKAKEIRLQYLEMALNILSEEPNQETIGLRLWAIDVVEKYSILQFSEEALEELKRSALPFRKILLDSKGEIVRDKRGQPIFGPTD